MEWATGRSELITLIHMLWQLLLPEPLCSSAVRINPKPTWQPTYSYNAQHSTARGEVRHMEEDKPTMHLSRNLYIVTIWVKFIMELIYCTFLSFFFMQGGAALKTISAQVLGVSFDDALILMTNNGGEGLHWMAIIWTRWAEGWWNFLPPSFAEELDWISTAKRVITFH